MTSVDSATPPFLSAREAAARLGVKPATLYAYVARGLLRSEPGEEGRARRYAADAIDALIARRKAHRSPEAAARAALFWGAPVIESQVSCIDGGRLYYRGLDASTLAAKATFEQVAELLWTGALGAAPRWADAARWTEADGEVLRRVLALDATREATPIERLQLVTPALALGDPRRFDTAPEQVIVASRRLVFALAAALGEGGAAPSVAETVLRALGGATGAAAVAAMDKALVLSAEHELNASTFAARVAASAGAGPYAVISAALATLGGPKHGGACERVEALVAEVSAPSRARAALLSRAARGDDVPGFGHPLYPDGDPRVPPMLDAARSAASRNRRGFDTVLALVDAAHERGLPPPTLDVALVAVAAALRLPPGSAGALFAIGRVAGWIAHALEQYAMDELIRPRARYVGPAPEAP